MKKLLSLFILLGIAPILSAQSIYSEAQLLLVKEHTASFPNGKTAFAALIQEAEKALSEQIVPVTRKTLFAVSGDPHDYVSMGPYWWPDPEQPDGLPYIRRDGERNPESASLDRVKIDRLLKTVRPLSLACFFTGDEKYARKAAENLRIWFLDPQTRMNPHLNYAQMIPGHQQGRGRAAGVIDTYSFVELIECIRLLEPAGVLTPQEMRGLREWFSDLTDWLLSSAIGINEQHSTNNHGTAYDVQVTAFSLFAGREVPAREFIRRFPENRIFAQIEPDGSQPRELARTTALHYTLYNLDHMMDMCMLADRLGIDLYSACSEDGRSIGKAVAFIAPWLGKPQSEFPYEQINDWPGNQQKLIWILRRSTFFAEHAEYDRLSEIRNQTSPEDLRWLLLGRSNRPE